MCHQQSKLSISVCYDLMIPCECEAANHAGIQANPSFALTFLHEIIKKKLHWIIAYVLKRRM